jgi:hypothetical protein
MDKLVQTVQHFFTDKHGKLAIAQFPNAPLIIWILATIVAHIVHTGVIHGIARIAALIALIIWAVMEIISGLSPFRRVLGGAVLVLMLVSLLRTL